MMVKIDKLPEIYQLHIILLKINLPIWRRILVRSDSSIADLHPTLQIAFDWSDVHLHRFLIRGKAYGIGRSGCSSFSTDAKAVCLAEFGFRINEGSYMNTILAIYGSIRFAWKACNRFNRRQCIPSV